MSGVIPLSVNGMSSKGNIKLQIPFCPCLLANLSPIIGLRYKEKRNLNKDSTTKAYFKK